MRAQQASIGSFYEQNGVIEYAALTKLQVKDPQAYMRERQPQGTALATCFVAPHVVERAEAEVEEACGAGGAIDLAGCFSFPVTDADLDALAEASAPLTLTLTLNPNPLP